MTNVSHKTHFMMGKSKDLSQDLHNVIVAKHTDGIGYRMISILLKVPVSTVGASADPRLLGALRKTQKGGWGV